MNAQGRKFFILLPVYSKDGEVFEDARYDLCWRHGSLDSIRTAGLTPRIVEAKSYGMEDLLLGKGLSVRFKFLNKLDVQDDDIVMLIDGTAKIDYKAIEDFLSTFQADSDVGFLFGQRPVDHETWGMTPERKEIERFENFLILEALKRQGLIPPANEHLLDGTHGLFWDLQCGCWGFRGKYFKPVAERLTASDYDLEVDVFLAAFRVARELAMPGSFIQYVRVTLAEMAQPLTRRQCSDVMARLSEKLNSGDSDKKPTEKDVACVLESALLLLSKKQSNFQPRSSIVKLASVSLALGITEEQYFDGKATWQQKSAFSTSAPFARYWSAADLLYRGKKAVSGA